MKSALSITGKVSAALAVFAAAVLLPTITGGVASAATQATYYVAPDGNDGNPGTISVAVQDPGARGTSSAP